MDNNFIIQNAVLQCLLTFYAVLLVLGILPTAFSQLELNEYTYIHIYFLYSNNYWHTYTPINLEKCIRIINLS